MEEDAELLQLLNIEAMARKEDEGAEHRGDPGHG